MIKKKSFAQALLLGLVSVALAALFFAVALRIYDGRNWINFWVHLISTVIFYLPLELLLTMVPGNYLLHSAAMRVIFNKPPGFFHSSASGMWVLLLSMLFLLLAGSGAVANDDAFMLLAMLLSWPLAVWAYCALARLRNWY